MTQQKTVSWIGCGKVGKTLAKALLQAGYPTGVVVCKHLQNAREAVRFIGAGEPETDLDLALSSGYMHFITTTDDALKQVVDEIDREGPPSLAGHYFFHTSGSISSTVFESLIKKGAEAASIHPLQVFADSEKALETLPGIYYAIEGTDRAMSLAVQMVDQLQGKLLLIPTGRKTLYHTAGVFLSNYLMVLIDYAMGIMEDLGETPEDAYEAFLPLMVGALQNVEEYGVSSSFTGPVSRGDLDTVKSHLKALEDLRPDVTDVYKVLGRAAVDISLRTGRISVDSAKAFHRLFEDAKQE